MIKCQIITNNLKVKTAYESKCRTRYYEISCMEMFLIVKKMIQRGHKLLTDPMAGSMRPNQMFCRTVLVSLRPGTMVDRESERIINSCLATCKRFFPLKVYWPSRFTVDFQNMDYTMLSYILDNLEESQKDL